MGQQLRGSSDNMTYRVKGRTVRRLGISVRMATTGGTSLMPDMDHVKLMCTLRRAGKDTIIFADTLNVLAKESAFLTSGEPVYMDGAGMVMTTTGSPVATVFLIPCLIDLKMPINLKGDDELILEGSMSSSWLPTGGVSADSSIDFAWRDDIGVETFIPRIRSKVVQAGSPKWEESLGDNVLSVSFIATAPVPLGGTFINDANALITNCTITSDKYDVIDTLDKMIAARNTQFENSAVANYRYRSFQYNFKSECDRVQVNLQLNEANVLAGGLYVVWRTFEIDPMTMARAAQIKAKHAEKDLAKIEKTVGKAA